MERIRDFLRNIKYGVRNLIKWFPVIYRDRDWDHTFLMEIMKRKMDNMQKYLRKYGHHVNAEKDADDIKKCVILLDRLIKDEYHENISKKYYEKWGELEFKESNSGFSTLEHTKVKTDEDKYQCTKESRILHEKEDNLRNQDLELLFNTMRRKILGWWD